MEKKTAIKVSAMLNRLQDLTELHKQLGGCGTVAGFYCGSKDKEFSLCVPWLNVNTFGNLPFRDFIQFGIDKMREEIAKEIDKLNEELKEM